ncbi:hypothetical protein D3Z55_19880 [Clostridiaceae bacterium]|nr:hypothetical protein [Clostridiaceae bacterium]
MINLLKEYQVFVYGFLFGNYTTILCVLHRELKYCHNVNDKSKCLKKKTLKAKQQKQNSKTTILGGKHNEKNGYTRKSSWFDC